MLSLENVYCWRQFGPITLLAAFLLLSPANGRHGWLSDISFTTNSTQNIWQIHLLILDEIMGLHVGENMIIVYRNRNIHKIHKGSVKS